MQTLHALPAYKNPTANWGKNPLVTINSGASPFTYVHPLTAYIRSKAREFADAANPAAESDEYLWFVQILHRIAASERTSNHLRWHARVALMEMGEDE